METHGVGMYKSLYWYEIKGRTRKRHVLGFLIKCLET